MTELYTMLRYLQPDFLKAKGLQHFDSFAANFITIDTVIDLDPTGSGYRPKKRCTSFNNIDELMTIFKSCADIQTQEMINLEIPKLKNNAYTVCVCEPSSEQKEFIRDCGMRADVIRSHRVDPHEDNMLKITNDGKMCALDFRLVSQDAEDRPDSKINVAVQNIADKYFATDSDKLTQAVFLDKSTPKNGEFNLYDDIKSKLIEKGIPEHEIRYIHEAKTDAQKQKMFDDVNKGNIRIIMGSTEKMGAGTNMQERLCALHHIDVPWRPSDVEQREGRILRFGNRCGEVEIFRYVTKDTFDAYSWQTIENKWRMISQIMSGKGVGRSVDDLDEQSLNYAEIKALSIGDSRIKEQLELDVAVKRLTFQQGQYKQSVADAKRRLDFEIPQRLSEIKEKIAKYTAANDYALGFPKQEGEDFAITVAGNTYNKRQDGGMAIIQNAKTVGGVDRRIIGSYRGFNISTMKIQYYLTSDCVHKVMLSAKGITLENDLSDSEIGTIAKLDNMIDKKLPELLEQYKQEEISLGEDIVRCKKIINTPFPYENELKEKSERLRELNVDLSIGGTGESVNDGLLLDDTNTSANKR